MYFKEIVGKYISLSLFFETVIKNLSSLYKEFYTFNYIRERWNIILIKCRYTCDANNNAAKHYQVVLIYVCTLKQALSSCDKKYID